MLQKIIVCLIAGAGAGFGTGLAGMSAAAVIAPMLVTFLQVKPYEAVGIALASDVLASAAKKAEEDYASSSFVLEQEHMALDGLYRKAEELSGALREQDTALEAVREQVTPGPPGPAESSTHSTGGLSPGCPRAASPGDAP